MKLEGYYRSEVIESVDWHAGAEIRESFYRFIKFFPDSRWLWADHRHADFDFPGLLASLDLDAVFESEGRQDPPISIERDHGHLYERGRYQLHAGVVTLRFYSVIADLSIEHPLTASSNLSTLCDADGHRYTHLPAD